MNPELSIFLKQVVVFALSLFFGTVTLFSLIFRRIVSGNKIWYVKERPTPPACLQDPALGKHIYVDLKGVKLHCVENGPSDKPLLLFLHGFPEFWYSWRHQLKYFKNTHRVVAVDLRGYGDSEKPASLSQYTMDILVQDIVELIAKLGSKNCTLIGHDWGGVISWNVATKHPELIKKLIILNAPHPAAMYKRLQTSIGQLLRFWYFFLFQLPILPEISVRSFDLKIFNRVFRNSSGVCCMTPEDLEAFKYTYAKKGAWTPPMNIYRNAFNKETMKEAANSPKIKIPTLIIWGEKDVALEVALPEMSREYVNNLKIEYIPTGIHFIQNDKPDEVNRAIEKFIQ